MWKRVLRLVMIGLAAGLVTGLALAEHGLRGAAEHGLRGAAEHGLRGAAERRVGAARGLSGMEPAARICIAAEADAGRIQLRNH